MPISDRGRAPRLHHPQVREILAHTQTVAPARGLFLVVRDLSGGGGVGLLHDLATGAPAWNTVRIRPVAGSTRPLDRSLLDSPDDTLLLIDDLHLADSAVLRLLREETSRLDRPSRLMVVGTVDAANAQASAPESSCHLRGDIEVVLPPITLGDSGAVVESSTGTRPHPSLVVTLHTMTGGRVDLLTELIASAPAEIRAGRAPAVPDTWSTALAGAVDAATADAPPESRRRLTDLLRTVAVSAGPSAGPVALDLVWDVSDGGTDAVFTHLLRTLPGPAVDFRDPRHRAAVLEQTPPRVLAEIHQRAARRETDPGASLYHRLQSVLAGGTGSVDSVVEQMLTLAAGYRDHGDWGAAARLLCTVPPGNHDTGNPDATGCPTLSADRVDALARAGDLPAARLWSRTGAGAAPGESYLAMHAGDRRRAYAVLDGGDTLRPAGTPSDVAHQRALLALADWDPHSMLDHAGAAGDDLLATVATGILTGSHPPSGRPGAPHRMVDGWFALVNDDPLSAREILTSTVSTADTVAPLLRIWRDAWLARTHYVLGDFEDARRVVERGLATGDAHGSVLLDPVLLWTGSQVAAFQGDASAAHQYTNRLPDDPEAFLIQRLPAAMSRMITTANSSDLVAALRVGESLARIGTEKDTQQPGFWPWEDVYAQCLVRAGKIRAAEAVVAEAEQRAGTGGLASLAAKLRVPRGSILLRRGDVEAGVRCFDEAVEIITDTPMRAYQSRILMEYGQVLRRLGRRRHADEIFSRAEEVFASMGAPAMVERCRRERRATGVSGTATGASALPTGATPGALTTQEEQIAVMAADGSTNRDIARELTLSAKTVEHHLTSCYRKLGIRGRGELSGALQRR
ncbi:helix-turn-helix transcriptional regulator [Corynebacterium sp.]|uniref:helix-turn-helix transcriptional regulator n=1 Tax=Corynebacterium sp. TaxID=1720 RepID=UPI003B3A7A0E